MQILLIALLIYYAAPKLLFHKKYTLFVILSLGLVLLCTFLISETLPKPPAMPHGRPPRPGGRPPTAPPQFFINFLVIGFAYVIATFIETFIFAQKKDEEIVKNKNETLQTELKLLKSQINPHFLFNSLNNIYALSAIDAKKTQESISYLSEMLRYVLYECEQERVPLEKELFYIKNYLKLFSLKSSNSYPITVDFQILDATVNVAPMLFIPFVENALKHSNIEKILGTFIRINLRSDSKQIQFQIENSVPNTKINKDAMGGIGIENVKKRLAILYPEKHHLSIIATKETYTAQLNIVIDEEP